jgi:DNA polymerase-3 subunit gamma/tau
VVNDIADRGMDYRSVLEELLVALHRVAMAQIDETLIASLAEDERSHIVSAASSVSAEDTQLFYQIGITGRRDLPLAPNPRSGLEMVLLRMLAFRPASVSTSVMTPPPVNRPRASTPSIAEKKPPSVEPEKTQVSPAPTRPSDNWAEVVSQLNLTGINQQLANNTVKESFADDRLQLLLDETFANLHSREREAALKSALAAYYGREISLNLRIGRPQAETPAAERQRQSDEKQQAAVDAIASDPNIAAIEEQFDARVKRDSIRPNAETGSE